MSGVRAARLVEEDHVDVASALELEHVRAFLGITVTSASSRDEDVEVVFAGEIEDATFGFTPFRNVFIGANGELTQTFDRSWKYQRVVGVATAPNKLMVAIRPPVIFG